MKLALSPIFALSLAIVSSSSAWAHGNKFSMTAEAISAAGEKFEVDEKASLKLFTGVKGWLDGDKVQVKVYLSDNTTVGYTCAMMEMNGDDDMMMCSRSGS